jgi:DNA primase
MNDVLQGGMILLPAIPEELIQQVREQSDIVEVISEYIQLKRTGRGYVGLCPFHSEKTPSFSVVPDKQFFHCFGCHVGGDVFKFIMEIEGISYVEAIKHLAEKAGIQIPEVEDNISNEDAAKKVRMQEAHLLAAKLYHHVLIHTKYGENAREYLKQRGLSAKTIEAFQIGFAPPKRDFLTQFLIRRGFNPTEMAEAGLIQVNESNHTYYDRFTNRIMFPIEDHRGKIVAFSGRLLGEGKPKYLNTPESPIFHKSNTLFNLSRAKRQIRKTGQMILLEGHVDAVQLFQAGIENVVASQGTAFSEGMARLIRRYTNEVVICFDGDDAGQEAASKAAEIMVQSGLEVRIAKLPEGLDPDDYIRKYGGEHFRLSILKNAMPITAFRLERLRKGKDLSDSIARNRYVEQALEQIAILPSAIERDHYITLLVEEFNIPPEVLRQEVQKLRRKIQQKEKSRDMTANKWNTNINNGLISVNKQLKPAYYNAERKLLSLMLKNKELIEQVMEEVGGAFNEPEHVAIAAEIYACVHENVSNITTAVLHRLSDPKLQNVVTSLIMDEADEPITDKGLKDLIQCILDYPKQKELEEMIKARQVALEMEDFNKARLLDSKIREVQKLLKDPKYKSN